MFSLSFFKILILAGLGWTALAALSLVVLLVIDWKRGQLW
jgi:hypothetical protein